MHLEGNRRWVPLFHLQGGLHVINLSEREYFVTLPRHLTEP